MTTEGRLPGDAGYEDAWVPPVNNANQLERVLGMLDQVRGYGEVVTGGGRQGDRDFYVVPTVVSGLRQDDVLSQPVGRPDGAVPPRSAHAAVASERCGSPRRAR